MRGAHQQQVPGGGIGSAGTACRRRQRSKPALLLLLLALCCQELAQRGAEAAGLAAEAAPKGSRRVAPGASKHITVRGRVRGGSLTFSRNNPALDQARAVRCITMLTSWLLVIVCALPPGSMQMGTLTPCHALACLVAAHCRYLSLMHLGAHHRQSAGDFWQLLCGSLRLPKPAPLATS